MVVYTSFVSVSVFIHTSSKYFYTNLIWLSRRSASLGLIERLSKYKNIFGSSMT